MRARTAGCHPPPPRPPAQVESILLEARSAGADPVEAPPVSTAHCHYFTQPALHQARRRARGGGTAACVGSAGASVSRLRVRTLA